VSVKTEYSSAVQEGMAVEDKKYHAVHNAAAAAVLHCATSNSCQQLLPLSKCYWSPL